MSRNHFNPGRKSGFAVSRTLVILLAATALVLLGVILYTQRAGFHTGTMVRKPKQSYSRIALPRRIMLYTGEKQTLKPRKLDSGKELPEISWDTKDPSTAQVTKGNVVSARKAGKTTLTWRTDSGEKQNLTVFVRRKPAKKVIYLTFDDGPGARNTPRLLNLLKKYDAKATFFLVGTEVSAHPEIVRREFREGHTVAIHTYTHNYNQIYKNTSAFFRDFDRIEKQLTGITGQKPRFNRMPGGSNNAIVSRKNAKTIQRILRKKGYVCMDWNAATNDAVGIAYSTDTMARYGMKSINAVRTPIVLIHDSDMKTKTVPVVKKLLKHYTKKGYSFEALDMYHGPAIQFTK